MFVCLFYERIYVVLVLSLRCSREFISNAIEDWSFPYGRSLFTNSISLVDIWLFRCFIPSFSVLVNCIFQIICPFHLSSQMYWYRVVHDNPFYCFTIYSVCSDVPSCTPDIGYLRLLSFLLSMVTGL